MRSSPSTPRGREGGHADFEDFRVDEPLADRSRNVPLGKVVTLTNFANDSVLWANPHGMLHSAQPGSEQAKGQGARFRVHDRGKGRVALEALDGSGFLTVVGAGLSADVRPTKRESADSLFHVAGHAARQAVHAPVTQDPPLRGHRSGHGRAVLGRLGGSTPGPQGRHRAGLAGGRRRVAFTRWANGAGQRSLPPRASAVCAMAGAVAVSHAPLGCSSVRRPRRRLASRGCGAYSRSSTTTTDFAGALNVTAPSRTDSPRSSTGARGSGASKSGWASMAAAVITRADPPCAREGRCTLAETRMSRLGSRLTTDRVSVPRSLREAEALIDAQPHLAQGVVRGHHPRRHAGGALVRLVEIEHVVGRRDDHLLAAGEDHAPAAR